MEDVIFFGVNDVGMEIYEWLTEHRETNVLAMITTEEQMSLVESLEPDYIVSVGYNHLIPKEILDIPKEAINLHPSLLPCNKGKSPNVWSIVEDTPAGVSLHHMTEEFDEGGIIEQKKIEKDFTDTGKSLHKKLEDAQFEIFTQNWEDIISGEVQGSEQEGEGTYHTTEDFKELCEIDLDSEYKAKDLINILRALTFPPFDNAYVEKNGKRYYLELNMYEESEEDKKEGFISSY